MKKSMIIIRCPVCEKGRLFDAVDQEAASKLRLCRSSALIHAEWLIKCPKCKSLVGISVFP